MLTVFGFGEHRAVFWAALQNHSRAEQVGTALQLNAGFPTEISHLVCSANNLYCRSIALPFVPVRHKDWSENQKQTICYIIMFIIHLLIIIDVDKKHMHNFHTLSTNLFQQPFWSGHSVKVLFFPLLLQKRNIPGTIYSLGFKCLSVALPAALLVQLQLSQHTTGLIGRIYQQRQHLYRPQVNRSALQTHN